MKLVVVCGLPGAGKTSVAEWVAGELDADHVGTDVVRKEIVSDPQYTDAEKRRVYEEVLERARAELAAGRPVVVDGTFTRSEFRDRAERLAADVGAEFRLLKVECDQDVVKGRIRERSDDHSEADFEVHKLYRDRFEPIGCEYEVVDNSGTFEETIGQVTTALDLPVVRADRA